MARQRILFGICAVCVVAACAARGVPEEELELQPGISLATPIATGEFHSYRIALKKNEFFRLLVDQQEADVEVIFFGPDGRSLQKTDYRWYGSEWAPVVATNPGDYRVEIRALRAGKAGRYTLRAEPPRPRIQEDELSVAAVLSSTAVKAFIKDGTLASKKKALNEAQRALELWKKINDRTGEAQTLNSIGYLCESVGEPVKALGYYQQAATIWRAIGDRAGEAEALHDSGAAYSALGDKQKALEYYAQALELRRQIPDHEPLAFTLSNMGVVLFNLGDDDKAAGLLQEALPAWKAADNTIGEAQAIMGLAAIYADTGETQKALESYEGALNLTRASADRRGKAYCLVSLGKLYDELGQQQKALDYLQQAVSAMQVIGDKRGQARALLNSGSVQFSLKRYQLALDLFDQAYRITNGVGDSFTESAALLNLARVRDAMGQPETAIETYLSALSLARANRDLRNEAICLRNLGETYYRNADNEQALNCLSNARKIFRSIGNPAGEASALLACARVKCNFGKLTEALADSNAATDQVESLRTKVAAEELRMSYFASKQTYYRFHVDLLMRLHGLYPAKGFDSAALETAERARARSLLEMIAEGSAVVHEGVDPRLVENERELERQLNAKAAALNRLGPGGQGEEPRKLIRKQMEMLMDQLRDVDARIRSSSPLYAALTQPQPLDTPDIQKQLEKSVILLEYFYAEEHTYLWAITHNSVKSFELPPPDLIQKAARRLRELSLKPGMHSDQAAAELGNILLGPLGASLTGKRVIIVRDPALGYVPFAALRSTAQSERPLVADHETIYLPSASIIGVLRAEISGRRTPSKSIAIFADPVFDQADERVAKFPTLPVRSIGDQGVKKFAVDIGAAESAQPISRLPFTRIEAKAIASLVPPSQSVVYLDFDANRDFATSPDLGHYRIVHFATHVFVNDLHPELSGILFSLVNRKGDEQDGSLRLHDIYNLKLPVELVVISGCESGLGKEVEGEGIIGLTRGFLYAGAARVLVSLWKVDDEATAEMMKEFYTTLFLRHLRPAAALRAAQNKLRTSKRWNSPYYWAGFMLIGEWR